MSIPISADDDPNIRITKLLPADITAAFIAIYAAVPTTDLSGNWIVYGAILIGLLAPFYFYLVLGTRNILHITFLLMTYIVFVVTLASLYVGNVFPILRPMLEGASVIITPIWIFVVTPIAATLLKSQLLERND